MPQNAERVGSRRASRRAVSSTLRALVVGAALVGAPLAASILSASAAETAPADAPVQLDLDSGPASEAQPAAGSEATFERGATPAFAAGVLVVGGASFVGASALVLAMLLRRRGARRLAEAAVPATVPALPAAEAPAPLPADGLVSVAADDLAEAMSRAGIKRVLVFASSAPEFVEAASLARRIARRNTPTILVDFAYSHAAREMGIVGRVEDVLTTAASPTTFAHGINRDRAGAAHLLAVELGPIDGNRDAIRAAAGTILAALGEAYEMTVAVVSSSDADCLEAMVDADTAIVVPSRFGHPSAAARTLDELAMHGVSDAVLMMVGAADERSRAA